MSQKVIKGTPKLSEAIRNRRQELGLTIEEAAAYFGIGVNKIREMTASKDCKYVVWNGSKRMVKRVPFKEYLENQYSI